MLLARLVVAAAVVLFLAPAVRAQRASYPPEEFTARREKLCAAVGDGTVLMFAASGPAPGVRFRQDNDFYYLTGNEDAGAALVMTTRPCRAFLFLPAQNEAQVRFDGASWLQRPGTAKQLGFESLSPLTELEEFLARRRTSSTQALHVRLSERDEVDGGRRDTAIHLARRQSASFGGQPSEDAWRVKTLRERYPHYELRDVSPLIDALRVVKSPREIEVLRRNGRLSAEGIRRAIEATAPGAWEYELEAAAAHVFLRGGAEGNAYPAIVGSGPNGNVWHYNRNERQMRDGELVVMDYGASLGYLTMDITRTWPVSGRFDELQARAYRCALETQKAIIAAMRPGATREDTRKIAKAIYEKWGFGDQRPASAGHFVGLAVHDVGDPEAPFAPGMVIAVEPIVEIVDKQLHVRVEDTVLVTDGEPEILSVGVPKEVDELLALVGRARKAR
jgi:Xaa-Pro aminopeptidase